VQSRHVTNAGFGRKSCATVKAFAYFDKSHSATGACWFATAAAGTLAGPPQEAPMAKEPVVPKDIIGLSFEDALKELEGIVQQLERGQVKLDEAITAYERGALLKRHCEQKLTEAKMKVEKIVFASDGSVSTQPADLG
jgi:exodeoxyribonuclease VII small subunit